LHLFLFSPSIFIHGQPQKFGISLCSVVAAVVIFIHEQTDFAQFLGW